MNRAEIRPLARLVLLKKLEGVVYVVAGVSREAMVYHWGV